MITIAIQCEKCEHAVEYTIDNTDIVLHDGELVALTEGWNTDEFGNVFCPECWIGELGQSDPVDSKLIGASIDKKLVLGQIKEIVENLKEKDN